MLKLLNKNLRRLCSKLGWPVRRRRHRRRQPKIVVVTKLGKSSSARARSSVDQNRSPAHISSAVIHPSTAEPCGAPKTIRFATFNAALFSMAHAVAHPHSDISSNTFCAQSPTPEFGVKKSTGNGHRPRSILKHQQQQHSPFHHAAAAESAGDENLSRQQKFARSRLRVSINLPDNEISLKKIGPSRSSSARFGGGDCGGRSSNRTVVEVLREVNADVLALQDVKAEEEKDMTPLSELASALGMEYVFAESWAPEYGNAILSRWPIKRWKAHKIFDDTDFRNVLKATIDVPEVGEINFFCTLLDHLDENWRLKQINAIIQSTGVPHVLAGGLNSLDETDYSHERWSDIVKYYEEMGKPTPKVEVMKYLKSKEYTDAKDFAGECESVVMIAKGQSVQGTCKYGTRVDYILSSPDAPYKFVPGSYSVISSKGTSDHHIVKVDIARFSGEPPQQQCVGSGKRTVKITHSSSPSKGIWKMHS